MRRAGRSLPGQRRQWCWRRWYRDRCRSPGPAERPAGPQTGWTCRRPGPGGDSGWCRPHRASPAGRTAPPRPSSRPWCSPWPHRPPGGSGSSTPAGPGDGPSGGRGTAARRPGRSFSGTCRKRRGRCPAWWSRTSCPSGAAPPERPAPGARAVAGWPAG